jgi:hypothetical protein
MFIRFSVVFAVKAHALYIYDTDIFLNYFTAISLFSYLSIEILSLLIKVAFSIKTLKKKECKNLFYIFGFGLFVRILMPFIPFSLVFLPILSEVPILHVNPNVATTDSDAPVEISNLDYFNALVDERDKTIKLFEESVKKENYRPDLTDKYGKRIEVLDGKIETMSKKHGFLDPSELPNDPDDSED